MINKYAKYFLFFLMALTFECFAQTVKPVKIRIINEKRIISPNNSFQIALEILPEPGQHIHWRNPGDKGEPFRVDWTLPEGVALDKIYWQFPQIYESNNNFEYGYSGRSLIVYRFITGAKVNPNTEINATVYWSTAGDSTFQGIENISYKFESSGNEINMMWYPTVFQFSPTYLMRNKTDWTFKAIRNKKSIEIFLYPPDRFIEYEYELSKTHFLSYQKGIFKGKGQNLRKEDKHYVLEIPLIDAKIKINEIEGLLHTDRDVWNGNSPEMVEIKLKLDKK